MKTIFDILLMFHKLFHTHSVKFFIVFSSIYVLNFFWKAFLGQSRMRFFPANFLICFANIMRKPVLAYYLFIKIFTEIFQFLHLFVDSLGFLKYKILILYK